MGFFTTKSGAPIPRVQLSPQVALTVTEAKMLDWVCNGLRYKEVARKLGCTWRNVDTLMAVAARANRVRSQDLVILYVPIFLRRTFHGRQPPD